MNSCAVLILVLVEDGLEGSNLWICQSLRGVLILVLVEDGLEDIEIIQCVENYESLNPCFSGRWS